MITRSEVVCEVLNELDFAKTHDAGVNLSPDEVDALLYHLDRIARNWRDAKRERDELRRVIDDVDDALYWLLNALHGNSRGGPEHIVSETEWFDAINAGKVAHERAQKLKHNAPDPTHERGGLDPLPPRE